MESWTQPTVPDLPFVAALPQVYDTAAGELVTLEPGAEGAGLYVCGITPYDATHMGHAATYLTFDTLNRALRAAGHTVRFVQNVTDVDEPLLERAERDGVHWEDLAAGEIDLFRRDMVALRMIAPDAYVGAVEGIPSDVAAVEQLLASGRAYTVPADGVAEGATDVYLDLAQVPTFGEVSGWTREEMLGAFAERGGDPDREGKRDPLDPLLWRAHREGEPHWEGGTLGDGRPGWHIECTTIARDHLGTPFLVQGGGDDLVFPHHEMSAAQSRGLTDDAFARHYVHQAMVGLDGEKMSKSKGNLVLVSRLRETGEDPRAIRLAMLSQHYRTAWSWTDQHLADAQQRLGRWLEAAATTRARGPETATTAGDEECGEGDSVARDLASTIAHDLDTPGALSLVDRWTEAVLEGTGAQQAGALAEGPTVLCVVDALLGVDLEA
ncbi:cysteine--1-D-myo-inosityl 2-amino-2-deoxy-alpha-D-glucopyranoside ligase [Kytococcus aerolatus]|uniref:cysteine--1-D-myo-inosityl 2-amino-2-deoxy-alpha-D-glucopyranoside ligase n=1 Tax=Kytococcus aerolatus TaxID=592308 RepID=UPI000B59026B|nr:cysteine--1-D-myo-inosityl 2-amino-2-deoxy-alpha-D-glucopyranoside ligase [Kytococcus aerolatus]